MCITGLFTEVNWVPVHVVVLGEKHNFGSVAGITNNRITDALATVKANFHFE